MKKRTLGIIVLTAAMLAGTLTGCGDRPAEAVQVTEQVEAVEPTETEEPETEAIEEVTEEPAEGTEAVEPETETELAEEEAAFTVKDMSATKYAKSSVNVRKGPASDYEKLGGLSTNQKVTVTGQADTGWYRIDYNGEEGYVSDKYLVDQKVATGTSGSGTGTSGTSSASGSNSSGNSAGTSGSNNSGTAGSTDNSGTNTGNTGNTSTPAADAGNTGSTSTPSTDAGSTSTSNTGNMGSTENTGSTGNTSGSTGDSGSTEASGDTNAGANTGNCSGNEMSVPDDVVWGDPGLLDNSQADPGNNGYGSGSVDSTITFN